MVRYNCLSTYIRIYQRYGIIKATQGPGHQVRFNSQLQLGIGIASHAASTRLVWRSWDSYSESGKKYNTSNM